MIGYREKLARVLDAMGGLYTVEDLLAEIEGGRMQSHVAGNTWAITTVNDFPRARQLNVVAMIGDLGDIDAIQAKLVGYASEVNAGLISAYGRKGWREFARERGWRLKAKTYLWHRDM